MVLLKVLFKTRSLYFVGDSARLVQKVLSHSRPVIDNNSGTMSFEAEKLKFLNMPLEEKRALYKATAKKNVVILDQIPTWVEYWKNNKSTIKKTTAEKVDKVSENLASKVSLWRGDITALEVDAIVNAANRSLRGGGGVDGVIHKMAGSRLKLESITLAPCEVGDAKITGGYALPAKYVIHTVGPQGEKPDKLRSCYEKSLEVARQNGIKSIAFPCISTGIYGYPQRPAAEVALGTVKKYLEEHGDDFDRVLFCVFLHEDEEIYQDLMQKYFALD